MDTDTLSSKVFLRPAIWYKRRVKLDGAAHSNGLTYTIHRYMFRLPSSKPSSRWFKGLTCKHNDPCRAIPPPNRTVAL